jgi:hypothetical protein
MVMNFENYLKDANTFVNQLDLELRHPEEKKETKRVLGRLCIPSEIRSLRRKTFI